MKDNIESYVNKYFTKSGDTYKAHSCSNAVLEMLQYSNFALENINVSLIFMEFDQFKA